jgi:hypothetical protein
MQAEVYIVTTRKARFHQHALAEASPRREAVHRASMLLMEYPECQEIQLPCLLDLLASRESSEVENKGTRGCAVHAWLLSGHSNILPVYAVEKGDNPDSRSIA